jgi:UDP-2,3-diacylglucosamine hydrolase
MIHGHTHRPARHASLVDGTPRERIVLADWDDRGHYLVIDATGIHDRDVDASGAAGVRRTAAGR